ITFDPALSVTSDRPRIAQWLGFGQVGGGAPGFTTLRATYLGFAAQADVEVTGMTTLVGLTLSMPPQIGLGQVASYSVIATFSDGSIQDVTFHPNTLVISIDPFIADAFSGLIFGNNLGSTLVIADHLGFSDDAFVTVVPTIDPI